MYNAIIENGSTYLFLDNGSDDVCRKDDMSGFLIHNSNIINLVESIPIKQYYVRIKEDLSIISKEQAYYLYKQIIDYNIKKRILK